MLNNVKVMGYFLYIFKQSHIDVLDCDCFFCFFLDVFILGGLGWGWGFCSHPTPVNVLANKPKKTKITWKYCVRVLQFQDSRSFSFLKFTCRPVECSRDRHGTRRTKLAQTPTTQNVSAKNGSRGKTRPRPTEVIFVRKKNQYLNSNSFQTQGVTDFN